MRPSFTLDPSYTIPADAPRSEMTEEQAQALSAASEVYATDLFEIALMAEAAPNERNWHCDYTLNGDPVDLTTATVLLNWGDGVDEVADEANEGHPYAVPGTYLVTVTLQRPGLPSLERTAVAEVVTEEPPA